MLHRVLHDPVPPVDTDADTATTAETEREIEHGERHLAMLSELAEIGMDLVRSFRQLAQARVERELKGETPPARAEDAAAAVDRMAQTVRRTLALHAKLAEGVKTRRQGLVTQRAERRTARGEAHGDAVKDAIVEGLHDAYAATCPDAEYNELADRLLDDAREYLGDADEMRGWLDRPIGETVAKLCAAMGLDPEACQPDGETWRIRRPPLDFEVRLEERARKYPSTSSLSFMGRDRSRSDQGGEVSMKPQPAAQSATPPQPDG